MTAPLYGIGLPVAKHDKRNQHRLDQHGSISSSDKEKLKEIQGLKSEKTQYHKIDGGAQDQTVEHI